MSRHVPPRYLWIIFYLLLNIGYVVAIVRTGHLFGESANVSLHPNTPVVLVGLLVCASYILVCLIGFQLLDELAGNGSVRSDLDNPWMRRVGPLVMLLQLLFMSYFLYTGTYVAGSNTRDRSILSAVWVLVPIDMIFLGYYGTAGRSRWARANMLVWIVSGLIRGWTGALLTVLFIESCRAIRARTLRFRTVALVALLTVLLYPPVYYAKLFYRFAGTEGLLTFVTTFEASEVAATFESVSAADAVAHSFSRVLDRLQIVSSATVAYQAAPELEAEISNHRVLPAWLEGIHGIGLFRSLGMTPPLDLGQAVAYYIDPLSSDRNWNSNPTLVGYLFATPFPFSVVVLLYATALCTVSIFVMRLLKWDENSKDILWYAWLVYLVPGWFGAFFLFIYSLVLLLALKTFMQILSRVRSNFSLPT